METEIRTGNRITSFSDQGFTGFINPDHVKFEVTKALMEECGNPITTNVTRITVLVTPEIAEMLWKFHNKDNRKHSDKHSKILMKAMEDGEWRNNYIPIVFDWNGNCLDGQHRLYGIWKSGKVIEVDFVIGADPSLYVTYDNNKIRKPQDDLQMHGEKNVTKLANVIRYVLRYESDNVKAKDSAASRVQYVELALSRPDLQEDVRIAERVSRAIGMNIGILGASHHIFKNIDEELCELFFHQLKTGENLSKGDPALALRNMAMRQKVIKNSNQKSPIDWTPIAQFARVVMGWNYFVDGKKSGGSIQYQASAPFPRAKAF